MSNRESFEELKKKIEQADVVSFDVFDTLILRIVNTPETIFKLVGDVCGIKDYEHIRQEMQRQASMEAEEKWNQPHAVMDQIYDYIKTHSGLEMDWEKVKQTELEMEYDSLVANPEMKEIYEFAKAAGKRVIATSDMYLKKDFLEKVLKNADMKWIKSMILQMRCIQNSAEICTSRCRRKKEFLHGKSYISVTTGNLMW